MTAEARLRSAENCKAMRSAIGEKGAARRGFTHQQVIDRGRDVAPNGVVYKDLADGEVERHRDRRADIDERGRRA
ncbi:MAG: hypothetical protein ACREE4_17825 [Stellaceae bacterium]